MKPEHCSGWEERWVYLSKFSPGLLFLHSSMCNQVVEDLSCEKRERGRESKGQREADKESSVGVTESNERQDK